jgi:hypothetical protein
LGKAAWPRISYRKNMVTWVRKLKDTPPSHKAPTFLGITHLHSAWLADDASLRDGGVTVGVYPIVFQFHLSIKLFPSPCNRYRRRRISTVLGNPRRARTYCKIRTYIHF